MECPFEVNEFVIVKGYSKDDPNYKARVVAIYPEKKKIWIANFNMPFYGTISEIVPYDAVEKIDKECSDCEIEPSTRQCEKCWRNPEDHEHYDTLAKE